MASNGDKGVLNTPVTAREHKTLQVIRSVKYGQVVVTMRDGEPCAAEKTERLDLSKEIVDGHT